MANGGTRLAWPAALTLAFASFVGMTVVLAGRLDAAPLVTVEAFGALAVAAIVSGRPIVAVRSQEARSRYLACAAGLVAVFAPAATVAAVRMSDAPAGSVVVFWMSAGWAAIAAAIAAAVAVRSRRVPSGLLSLAGGVTALAGVAGVVANWERPSSFSPLVRFPVQELAILSAGGLALAGAYAVLRASRTAPGKRTDGALLCAAATATAAGLVWWVSTGFARGLDSVMELPVQVAVAALAWGVVCVAVPRLIEHEGPARTGALLAFAPLLLTALIWVEQAFGVAGPQPLVVTGVVAGGITLAAGAVALWWSAGPAPKQTSERSARSRVVFVAAAAPLLLACIALALPTITAAADVRGSSGSFVGSWTLLGWESVAGLAAVGLAALLAVLAGTRRPTWPAVVALAACAAWPWSLAVPMHVLTGWLPVGIEQYYGTEYGSIAFTAVTNGWMMAAVIASGAGFAALIVSDTWRRLFRADAEPGK